MPNALRHLYPVLLLLSLLTTGPLRAQLAQVQRLEVERNAKDDEQFEVTTLGRDGVLLTKKTIDPYTGTALKWQFTQYDTDLRPRWQTDFRVKFPLEPLLSYVDSENLYWLFGEPDSEKILILRLSLATGDTETIDGRLMAVEAVSQFRVLGNKAFIAGKYHDRSVVVLFSFFDKTEKVLPTLYANNLDITSLDADLARNQMHIIVRTFRRGKCQLNLKTFSYEGKLLHDDPLPGDDGRTLLSGQFLRLNDRESLLIGSYSQNCSDYSQGVYLTRIGGEAGPEPLRYLEFADLKNFFNYLKPARQQRVLARIARKKEEGKEARFRYLLLVHDLVPTPEGFILVAEAFYPQYKSSGLPGVYSSFGGARGNNVTRSADNFKYTHAFVCGFDRQGKLLWDNGFALNDVTSYELEEQVQLTRHPDRLVLAYPSEDRINSLVLRDNQLVADEQSFELKPKNQPKVLDTEQTTLAAWHDQYFLAWGIQRINSPGKAEAPREVFYLNKLGYSVK